MNGAAFAVFFLTQLDGHVDDLLALVAFVVDVTVADIFTLFGRNEFHQVGFGIALNWASSNNGRQYLSANNSCFSVIFIST
jgi:hypothetical protein